MHRAPYSLREGRRTLAQPGGRLDRLGGGRQPARRCGDGPAASRSPRPAGPRLAAVSVVTTFALDAHHRFRTGPSALLGEGEGAWPRSACESARCGSATRSRGAVPSTLPNDHRDIFVSVRRTGRPRGRVHGTSSRPCKKSVRRFSYCFRLGRLHLKFEAVRDFGGNRICQFFVRAIRAT